MKIRKKIKKIIKYGVFIFFCGYAITNNSIKVSANQEQFNNDIFLYKETSEENNEKVSYYDINIGSTPINISDSRWNQDEGVTVYYGEYNGEPVLYRVLSDSNNTQIIKEGCILLDSDRILYRDVYDEYYSNVWTNSTVRQQLDELYKSSLSGEYSLMSYTEAKNVAKTQLVPYGGHYSTGLATFKDVESYDAIFMLSAMEVACLYTDNDARRKQGGYGCWWLRSSNTVNPYFAGFVISEEIWDIMEVEDMSSIFPNGCIYNANVDTDYIGICPAFNVNESSILFTSVCEGFEKDKSVQEGKVYENNNRQWKITLLDDEKTVSLSDKEIIKNEEGIIKIPYSYTDTNEQKPVNQISVMIADRDYTDETAKILFYGALQNIVDIEGQNGIGELSYPDDLPDTYKVYLIAEHVSGNCFTDYASVPVDITREMHFHNYETKYDEQYHWEECTEKNCYLQTTEKQPHEIGSKATCMTRNVCKVCGASYGELDSQNHNDITYVSEEPSTCLSKGHKAYYECRCGNIFSDPNGEKEKTSDDILINANGHVESDWLIKPDLNNDIIKKYKECIVCGALLVSEDEQMPTSDVDNNAQNKKNFTSPKTGDDFMRGYIVVIILIDIIVYRKIIYMNKS